MAKRLTDSGVLVYNEFNDRYNHYVRVDRNIDSTNNVVRILCKKEGEFCPTFLNVKQAKRMIAALQEFVDTFDDDWEGGKC